MQTSVVFLTSVVFDPANTSHAMVKSMLRAKRLFIQQGAMFPSLLIRAGNYEYL